MEPRDASDSPDSHALAVLEIAGLIASDIDPWESHWERILASRDFGYNRN
jgi:hypothetical protein